MTLTCSYASMAVAREGQSTVEGSESESESGAFGPSGAARWSSRGKTVAKRTAEGPNCRTAELPTAELPSGGREGRGGGASRPARRRSGATGRRPLSVGAFSPLFALYAGRGGCLVADYPPRGPGSETIREASRFDDPKGSLHPAGRLTRAV